MTDERPRCSHACLIATTVVLVMLGAYVGAYFQLVVHEDADGLRCRGFHNRFFTVAYFPMGWIECRVSGEIVIFHWQGQEPYADYPTFEPP